MTKQEKRLDLLLKNKNFQPKYLKNIIINICHGQSICARTQSCRICGKGISAKELKKMDGYSYGIRFGEFWNKRHQKRDEYGNLSPKFFQGYTCMDCIKLIEEKLCFTFEKSYAP